CAAGHGGIGYGFARRNGKGHAGAHYATEQGDPQAFSEIKLADGFALLFVSQFAFFVNAGFTAYGDTAKADGNAGQDDEAGGGLKKFCNCAEVHGWYKGAEGSAGAQGEGVAEGHAEVPHG